MAGGVFLCLDCRHEHDGTQPAPVDATTTAADDPIMSTDPIMAAVLSASTVAEVLAPLDGNDGTPPVVETAAEGTSTPNLAGRFIRAHGVSEWVLCVADDGGGTVQCQHGDGGSRIVDRHDVFDIDNDGTDPLAPTVGAETVSEDQPFSGVIMGVAALALAHGVACIGDDAETLYNPRIGWLPPPCDQVPEVEQGVAYAVALLIVTFGLDKGSVEQIAATLMQGAESPELETTQ